MRLVLNFAAFNREGFYSKVIQKATFDLKVDGLLEFEDLGATLMYFAQKTSYFFLPKINTK